MKPPMQSNKNPSKLSTILRADLPASIVVFFVALPLCLGIALASGAPLLSGIIAGVVGGIVVGSLSGSPLGVSGPAAGLAVIVLSAIEELGAFDIFLVAVILAGVIQIILGFLRAGIVAYYFPSAVISGMLAGIGIIIFLKQIPHALGYDGDPEGDLSFNQVDGETTFSEVLRALDLLSSGPIIIAAVSLVILILWDTHWLKSKKILGALPGPLVAVVTGIGLQILFQSSASLDLKDDQLVRLPISDGLSGIADLITFPDFSALGISAVYTTAILIAVVGSLETLLCVEATDKLDTAKRITPTNRELKAQGAGNIVSGLIGGLPITQVIVRSSANIQAGGQSKASAILHGCLLMIAVIALPMLMNFIPLASLAAVLLIVGYKLAKPSLFKKMYRGGLSQFLPFAVTVVVIVRTDLLIGIAVGLAVSIAGILIENFQIPVRINNSPQEAGEEVKIVLSQHVSFLNKASILKTLSTIPDDSNVEIDANNSVYVHSDVVEIIHNFEIGAKERNIQVVVKGLEHLQKGQPSGGAEVTITLPSKQQKEA